MARATVTVRELKNKDTGIDLSVNSFREMKGMLGSTYEYQVMVVSNLLYFKSAKHKDTDNVQFTLYKKLNEFEDLHHKFNTKYSGTVFPPIPKKVLLMNEAVVKERRNALDRFMRYLASMPKLCTDQLLLEFLGVSQAKAGKLKKIEVSESIVNKDDQSTEGQSKTDSEEETEGNEEEEDNLFEDAEAEGSENTDDVDLFVPDDLPSSAADDLKIFDEPDLSGALQEGEDDDLFIAGARTGVKVSPELVMEPEESTNELLSIDDDLDKLMTISVKQKEEHVVVGAETVETETEVEIKEGSEEIVIESTRDTEVKDSSTGAPSVKSKPVLPNRPKPPLANKPKPALKDKPALAEKPAVTEKPKTSVVGKPKPPLKTKPELKPKPGGVGVKASAVAAEKESEISSSVDVVTEDDIMKYIQENTADGDDDLDLFS